ncbi:hypothetical protein JOE38_000447 [Clavibacter michiganensis]|uniref:hypothetical protein n=1 Tax=Clavibacter michiganensis TaxID=28447 RepID=UPI001E12049D|nr:hypothetical protein [Clavibacter michiganensis]MBM7410624.1 hypothetical protein [Clavibacter michiganensis]
MTTSTSTTGLPRIAGKTWVAFGATGALASIHSHDDGYEVRPLRRGVLAGTYPTLEIAKAALRAVRGDELRFTEH